VCGLSHIAVSWAMCILCTDFAEARPLPLLKNIDHDIPRQEEQRGSCGTSRRISTLLGVPRKRFWWRSRTEGLYLYHVQWCQHLKPADLGSRLESFSCKNAKPICYVIFCLPTRPILPVVESTVSDISVMESWWSKRNSRKCSARKRHINYQHDRAPPYVRRISRSIRKTTSARSQRCKTHK
jgi:hypothetical protein